ncbi:MAG: hypothetical protein CMH49_07490, partial [Myxococcales bacterium]|nr:hypothetical protein [Myxococcales bacterium]
MFSTLSSKKQSVLTLLLGAFFFLPASIFAQELNEAQTIEGSAFDSMEDLVSEFDEELDENDLEQAIQADSDEEAEEPKPNSEPQIGSKAENTTTQEDQVPINTDNSTEQVKKTSEVAKTKVSKTRPKAKFNALLILKSKQRVKIRINKRYRGIIAAGKTR